MTRWTIVAIAVALGACSKGERNELSRSTSDTAAVDSVTAMASDSMPSDTMSARAIPADSSSMKKTVATGAKPARAVPDTKSTAPAYTDTRKDAGLTGAEAMTGVRAAPVTHELTTDQAKQLQAALNKAGCNAGTPDGAMGRRTQRAISCALEKYKLNSNDTNGLYRKLGLDF